MTNGSPVIRSPYDVGMKDTHTVAHESLRTLTGNPDAEFRDGQLEAIDAVLTGSRRALVVQRTGWGKSAVYFIATRILRDRGFGPTVIVSPLLALMRNQVEGATRLGLTARTVNFHQPRQVGRGLRGDRQRPRRHPPHLARTPQQPIIPHGRPPWHRQPHGAPRHRRGPLHLRLGPRLSPRLPAPRARRERPSPCHSGARHDGDGE